MLSAATRDIARSITKSLERFIAVMGIVALGSGFFAGLKMAGPVMRKAAEVYYAQTELPDIRLLSTVGLTDKDIERISEIDGVNGVVGTKNYDVLATLGTNNNSISARLSMYKKGQTRELTLVEGRLPEAYGEAVISADATLDLHIGDRISITKLANIDDMAGVLDTTTFTVVGLVRSSMYPSIRNFGTTSLGDGSLDDFIYVSDANFAKDSVYTEADIEVAKDDGYAGSYAERVQGLMQALEEAKSGLVVARRNDIYDTIDAEIADKQKELDDKKSESEQLLQDKQKELDAAKDKLASTKLMLDSAYADIAAGQKELSSKQASTEAAFRDAEDKLQGGEASFLAGLGAKGISTNDLDEAKQTLADKQSELDGGLAEMQSGLDQLNAQIDAMTSQLEVLTDEQEKEVLEKQIAGLVQKKAELEGQVQGLKSTKSALATAQAELQKLLDAKAELARKKDVAHAELSSAAQKLEASQNKVDAGYADYRAGLTQLEDGQKQLDQAKADADAQFAEAQGKIDSARVEAKQKLADSDMYLLGRDKFEGPASYQADSERIDAIANVFPILFYLVAALVSLTTMTRMVEDDRLEIGTRKALGYGKLRIASKYLLYALLASGIGSIIGTTFLSQLLPYMVSVAYQSMYAIPLLPMPYLVSGEMALFSQLMGMAVCLCATLFACLASLREKPAELMLPRSPKAGKRILLERIPIIWSRMSFSWKVSTRNIFRYKRRLGMTVLGVAGCTALLLVGLGLRDALADSVGIQFAELIKYEHTISLRDATVEARQTLDGELGGNTLWLHRQTMFASSKQLAEKDGLNAAMSSVNLVVPKQSQNLSEYVDIRNRTSKVKLTFDDSSVIVTEKLADTYGLHVGDTIALFSQDSVGNAIGEAHVLTIDGICENYIGNTIYVGSAAFSASHFDEDIHSDAFYDSAYAKQLSDADVTKLLQSDIVSSVQNTADQQVEYNKVVNVSSSVVILLIVSAALLCAIVLYNLTNINVCERIREVATLRVLGFTHREVDAYVFREIILLALLGDIVGLIGGTFLERFVMQTAEVDYMMFGRTIHPVSYLVAFALTLVFALVVLMLMRPHLHKIDMVSSLKSVE